MIRAVLVRVMLATEMSGCQRLKIPNSEREERSGSSFDSKATNKSELVRWLWRLSESQDMWCCTDVDERFRTNARVAALGCRGGGSSM